MSGVSAHASMVSQIMRHVVANIAQQTTRGAMIYLWTG
jgi:CHASE2 domain-containing sensor protein